MLSLSKHPAFASINVITAVAEIQAE